MWIEIPKKCEDVKCKEKADYFFVRATLLGSHWGFYCKEHAQQRDRGGM